VFDDPPSRWRRRLTPRADLQGGNGGVPSPCSVQGAAEETALLPKCSTRSKKAADHIQFELKTWPEFCVNKAIADYAEILQWRSAALQFPSRCATLARITMPEEKFHAKFGKDFCIELIRTGNEAVQMRSTDISRSRRDSRRQQVEEQRDVPALRAKSRTTTRCAPTSSSRERTGGEGFRLDCPAI